MEQNPFLQGYEPPAQGAAAPQAEKNPFLEGYQPTTPPKTAAPSWSQEALDVAKTVPAAAVHAVTGLGGLPGTIEQNVVRPTAGWIAQKLGAPAPDWSNAPSVLPTISGLNKTVEGVTGPLYQPKYTPGKITEAAIESAPALVGGPEGLAYKALQAGLSGTGQVLGERYGGPWGGVAGSFAGALSPQAAMRAITPNPISAERLAAVNALRAEGISPTAGQTTGSAAIRNMEGELGGAESVNAAHRTQFTRSMLNRIGEDAPAATPQVLDRAFNRIGQTFEDVGTHYAPSPDAQLITDLRDTVGRYTRYVKVPNRFAPIENTLREITEHLNGPGGFSGQAYTNMRSQLGKDAWALKYSDPLASQTLFGIQKALDDSMGRAMTAAGNPHDIAAWREARRQYRNLMVIDRAATRAPFGILSPAAMRQATVAKQGERNYNRGRGDFATVVRAANDIMTPLPNSGTAGRTWARTAATLPFLAAGLGWHLGGAEPATLAGLGTIATEIAAPWAAGKAIMSRPVQSWLGNQYARSPSIGNALRRSGAIAGLSALRNPWDTEQQPQ